MDVKNLMVPANLANTRLEAGVDVSREGWSSMHSNKTPVYSTELARISEALIASGYISLDEQAKALGIHRNTAWTIVKNKHKLGRLSTKTIDRILTNPGTPPSVRAVVQQYLAKRSDVVPRKRKLRLTPSSR
jgi:hypothetical protein